jgi:hypothetical protein
MRKGNFSKLLKKSGQRYVSHLTQNTIQQQLQKPPFKKVEEKTYRDILSCLTFTTFSPRLS